MSVCFHAFACCALICCWGLSVPLSAASAEDTTTVDPAATPPAGDKPGATVDEPEIFETPDVIISATKTELPVKQVTSAVEVITGDQMQARRLKTVADALRWAQGLTVFQSGGPGTTADVRMRGGTPAQTLVLIDGAIVNNAALGGYDFANLTTDNIERIEILRGNQSMLWGADAMGGVINITTKRGRGTTGVGAFAEYGSFDTIREGANLSGKKGIFDFAGTISKWDSASFSAINYRRGAFERDGYHNWQGSVRLGVELPKDGRLEFNFRWLEGILSFDGFSNSGNPADVFGAGSKDHQYVYSGSYAQPITNWWSQKLTMARTTDTLTSHSGQAAYDIVTGTFETPDPTFNIFNSALSTVSNRIEWQNNFQVAKPLLLTAGYQFREQMGVNQDLLNPANTIPNTIISSNAGFGEAQLNLWDRVFGTAGIRYDDYNMFGTATTYRMTAGYLHKETGTKLRGSYATGFRAPTINDLFFPGFGNPNLKPEKSQGMDIALEQTLPKDRGTLSLGYFWNRYRDLIVTTGPDPTICTDPRSFGFCSQNVGIARAQGVEASAKVNLYRDEPWMKSLDLMFQYTYTATNNLTPNAAGQVPDTRLAKWPLNQWSTIVSYQPIETLRANLEGRYVGNRYNFNGNQGLMPSFLVWNLSATYDVTKQIQVYTRVDNLFNEKYEEVLFFGTPIRSIYGGLRMNFDVPI